MPPSLVLSGPYILLPDPLPQPKNWCFRTAVLEKTFESPLDSKEIKPVNLKWNQSWIFIGRTDAEVPVPWPPDGWEELTHWKRHWGWERLKAGREGDDRGWDGWYLKITRLARRFLLRKNMSLSKIHCCYIIIGTEFKERQTLWARGIVLLCDH